MSGEKDLACLLSSLSPVLKEGEYVFCTFKQNAYGDNAELMPLAAFQEDEGLTLVIEKEVADSYQLSYEESFRCITFMVHSSLAAVGLTAAVSGLLADHDISANMIAAYYHDHLFIPVEQAEEAYDLLKNIKQAWHSTFKR